MTLPLNQAFAAMLSTGSGLYEEDEGMRTKEYDHWLWCKAYEKRQAFKRRLKRPWWMAFIEGVTSIFDIWPLPGPVTYEIGPVIDDIVALRSDWIAVGEDLQETIRCNDQCHR